MKTQLTDENKRQRIQFLRQWRARLKDNPSLLEKIASMDTILESDVDEIKKSKLSIASLSLLLESVGEETDIILGFDDGEGINQYG